MPRPEIRPFSEEHLEPAASLLAAAHARHLAAEPLLGRVDDYRAQVAQEWEREGASGAIAFHGGEPAGYLLGAPAANDNRGNLRVFSGIAAHATADAELARDLFAAAAGRWHEEGHTRFAVVVPAHDAALVDAWFRAGFGLQFASAVREPEPAAPVENGVTVRPAVPEDVEHFARLDRELWEHQTGSPSFSGMRVDPLEPFLGEWREETFDSPDTFRPFVAERDGEVVGEALLYRRPAGDLRVPENSIDLAHAVTYPAVRGSGAGLALAAFVLRWAHEHGFAAITTDWRSVNLLASRFWRARGFRETYLRLYRAVP